MNEGENKYDVIIIGGGAAGLSAALWCDELGLSALLLEKETEFGGQLLRVYNAIENHLGVGAENGRQLRNLFVYQTEKRGFARYLRADVSEVDLKRKSVFLEDEREFTAKALIAATGVRRRKLGVQGEDFLAGKGIIESGKKDADSVAGKSVLIVGGGDAALENALILAETAREVFIVHRRKIFRARNDFLEKVLQNPRITIFTESAVRQISGGTIEKIEGIERVEEKVEDVEVQNLKTGELQNLSVQAVLIRIGVEPNTELFRGKLELDADGYIKIDAICETSEKGVYAVGDVANPIAPTVSGAVGTGATAAKAIFTWLNL